MEVKSGSSHVMSLNLSSVRSSIYILGKTVLEVLLHMEHNEQAYWLDDLPIYHTTWSENKSAMQHTFFEISTPQL